jgi:transcriptional/translational regulatory protein YebC/TACO1
LQLLVDVGGVTDPLVLAAAALHDVLEDCEVGFPELEARFGTADAARLEWWATKDIKLDEERAKDVLKLLDLLDDHDDIQNIYANLEVE